MSDNIVVQEREGASPCDVFVDGYYRGSVWLSGDTWSTSIGQRWFLTRDEAVDALLGAA